MTVCACWENCLFFAEFDLHHIHSLTLQIQCHADRLRMVKYFDSKDLTNLKCPWCTKSYRRLYAYFVFSMYLVAMFRDISPETCSPFGARQPGTSSLILYVSHSWRSTKEKKTSWCSAVYKRWMQVVLNTSQPEQMNVSTVFKHHSSSLNKTSPVNSLEFSSQRDMFRFNFVSPNQHKNNDRWKIEVLTFITVEWVDLGSYEAMDFGNFLFRKSN